MTENKSKYRRFLQMKALGAIPVVVALVVVIILVKSKSGPLEKEVTEGARVLRVITVPTVDLIPRAIGYGIAEPAQVWRAVAEVRGRVMEINPDLKAGAFLAKGSVLLTIDRSEYEIALNAMQASLDQTIAELAELEGQAENTRNSLQIEKRSLLLAEQSLKRKQSALQNRTIPVNEVDQEERTTLGQRQRVQELENTLALLPSRKKALAAKRAAAETGLKQAQRDLAKTVISAPFDCRIGAVAIEPDQYLAAGQVLFEAHGTAITEIEAQLLGEQLRHLIGLPDHQETTQSLYPAAMEKLTAIKAIVRLQSGDWKSEWDARVDRLREEVDPDTRAFNVIVAVDRPYEKIIPGQRPPLSRGLFCEVELQGPLRPGRIVIPRSAVHGDTVFVLGPENRLLPVTVSTASVQSDLAIIASGLAGGETLVVSDPAPAITGMLVTPVWAEEVEKKVIADAQSETVAQ